MADGSLTISNPQQISVIAEVHFPGHSVQGKLLVAGEQWQVSGPTSGQWVAFSVPETGEMLAAALLPDNSTIAQVLLDPGFTGLLRMNAQEPLTAQNELGSEVIARVQDVGAATSSFKKLAPRGQAGSTATFPYAEAGQWLGFYDTAGNFITGTPANSFSMVTLVAPRQRFVIGNPYPVSPEAAPEGQVRPTWPAVQKAG